MSAYDFDPDVCLLDFHGIAEEISSGVSGNDLKKVCPRISSSEELLAYVRNTVASIIKQDFDSLWVNYRIPDKLKHMKEQEKSAKCKAWRPATGKADLSPITTRNLMKRKTKFMKQIGQVQEEMAKIVPYLKNFSEQTKQQLEEVDSVEKEVVRVFNQDGLVVHCSN